MSDAGKWLSRERGAADHDIPAAEVKPQAARYPLADRLTPIELVLLYSFREGLPEQK